MLESLDGPALFWLDGHYMGGESGRGTEDTPVMAEMTALFAYPVRGHVVLIDDARLFDGTGGYPRLDEFTTWVQQRRPGTNVTVDGDIIRCVFDVGGLALSFPASSFRLACSCGFEFLELRPFPHNPYGFQFTRTLIGTDVGWWARCS